ncbi:hypothetical protein WJR50_13210 [Catalinimonas sp. 4WD22]|uniref:hypothetical protein n=1 Tax=Catalinimonas locisalis TaxID=3133978 RepID=UPI003101B0BD
MAEIHVERKTKKPVWPWVVLLIIVLLIVVGWIFFNDASNDQLPDDVEINSIEQTTPERSMAYELRPFIFST